MSVTLSPVLFNFPDYLGIVLLAKDGSGRAKILEEKLLLWFCSGSLTAINSGIPDI